MAPRDYDTIVSAEVPEPQVHPSAYATVTKHTMHGPCGPAYPNAPCMENGCCSKGHSKRFIEETSEADDSGYPLYRRPNNGRVYRRSPNGPALDNTWVVPHNLYLCTKYDAHSNVEICTSIRAVKYLYKYVYKGHDRALISMRRRLQGTDEEINEIEHTRTPDMSLPLRQSGVFSASPSTTVPLQCNFSPCISPDSRPSTSFLTKQCNKSSIALLPSYHTWTRSLN